MPARMSTRSAACSTTRSRARCRTSARATRRGCGRTSTTRRRSRASTRPSFPAAFDDVDRARAREGPGGALPERRRPRPRRAWPRPPARRADRAGAAGGQGRRRAGRIADRHGRRRTPLQTTMSLQAQPEAETVQLDALPAGPRAALRAARRGACRRGGRRRGRGRRARRRRRQQRAAARRRPPRPPRPPRRRPSRLDEPARRSPSATARTSSGSPATTSSSAPSAMTACGSSTTRRASRSAYAPRIGIGVDDGALGFGSLWLRVARETADRPPRREDRPPAGQADHAPGLARDGRGLQGRDLDRGRPRRRRARHAAQDRPQDRQDARQRRSTRTGSAR